MIQRTLDQRLGGGRAILRQNLPLHRAGVHPDADGHVFGARRRNDRLHPVIPADVARVDAHLMYTRGD